LVGVDGVAGLLVVELPLQPTATVRNKPSRARDTIFFMDGDLSKESRLDLGRQREAAEMMFFAGWATAHHLLSGPFSGIFSGALSVILSLPSVGDGDDGGFGLLDVVELP
jgi:hypothetical protein